MTWNHGKSQTSITICRTRMVKQSRQTVLLNHMRQSATQAEVEAPELPSGPERSLKEHWSPTRTCNPGRSWCRMTFSIPLMRIWIGRFPSLPSGFRYRKSSWRIGWRRAVGIRHLKNCFCNAENAGSWLRNNNSWPISKISNKSK